MNQSPDKLRQWFEANKNRVLKIAKKEDRDLDVATIELKEVDFVHHQDPDNYVSAQALLLKGEGTVYTDNGKARLPYDTFEISLTDQWSSESDEHSLHLHTERGVYTIELDSDS